MVLGGFTLVAASSVWIFSKEEVGVSLPTSSLFVDLTGIDLPLLFLSLRGKIS